MLIKERMNGNKGRYAMSKKKKSNPISKVSDGNKDLTRLNKFISSTGLCSRREADKLIENGRVLVNGVRATVGTKVNMSDQVVVDGKNLNTQAKPIYIALNKPVGITCTTEKKVKDNIISFMHYPKRIFPIGRLDKDSEGLIFLTNDGDIVNKILRAGNNHEKEYLVTVNKPITSDFIAKMGDGVPVLDTITKKCAVKKIGTHIFNIVLTEGMNRQIRRMCEFFGYDVVRLQRVRIMNIKLGKLTIGEWRYLTNEEIQVINRLVEKSTKTEEASLND